MQVHKGIHFIVYFKYTIIKELKCVQTQKCAILQHKSFSYLKVLLFPLFKGIVHLNTIFSDYCLKFPIKNHKID